MDVPHVIQRRVLRTLGGVQLCNNTWHQLQVGMVVNGESSTAPYGARIGEASRTPKVSSRVPVLGWAVTAEGR